MTRRLETSAPETVFARLADVRKRTLELISVLDWTRLRRQHTPILSPMVWDLGHVGSFEETWVAGNLADEPPLEDGFREMFDPVVNPRFVREDLPLPTGSRLLEYLHRVRERTLELLRRGELADGPLTEDGYVFEMVAEHEEQHQETLLQCMQILEDPPYRPANRRSRPDPAPVDDPEEMIEIPEGEFRMGTDDDGFVYDNERPRHTRSVASFSIGRFPVTNRRYLEFVEDDGYRRRDLWSEEGWSWLDEARQEDCVEAPRNWFRRADGWYVRFMDRTHPVSEVGSRPVQNVCYWEADAFARWAGKRLPTEAEWEKAALWDPVDLSPRRFPWGGEAPTTERANLDQLTFGPAAVGSFPAGASAYGVEQLLGDVWEWTATDFDGYPGFEAFPYPEYSEIFFGPEFKVLRGGSWATRPAVARGTVRNWDYPIRRQIFAGIRLADGD